MLSGPASLSQTAHSFFAAAKTGTWPCFNSSDWFFPTPVSTKTQLSELAVEGLSQLSEELDEESGFFLPRPLGRLSFFSPASFAPSSLAQAPFLSGRPKKLFPATRHLSELLWLPPGRHPHEGTSSAKGHPRDKYNHQLPLGLLSIPPCFLWRRQGQTRSYDGEIPCHELLGSDPRESACEETAAANKHSKPKGKSTASEGRGDKAFKMQSKTEARTTQTRAPGTTRQASWRFAAASADWSESRGQRGWSIDRSWQIYHVAGAQVNEAVEDRETYYRDKIIRKSHETIGQGLGRFAARLLRKSSSLTVCQAGCGCAVSSRPWPSVEGLPGLVRLNWHGFSPFPGHNRGMPGNAWGSHSCTNARTCVCNIYWCIYLFMYVLFKYLSYLYFYKWIFRFK